MTKNAKVILVVDDSRTARMMIRTFILKAHPQWIVLEAASGPEALEIVERDTPNCVTMDVNMPGVDGIAAARMILDRHPGTRIVLFTANMQESTRREAEEMGARFVAKPITEQSVTQALTVLDA